MLKETVMLINVRVWIKDNHMSDSPEKKDALDFCTNESEEIIKDIIRDGFKYICDSKRKVMRYIPASQILTVYLYPRTDDESLIKDLPEIIRI